MPRLTYALNSVPGEQIIPNRATRIRQTPRAYCNHQCPQGLSGSALALKQVLRQSNQQRNFQVVWRSSSKAVHNRTWTPTTRLLCRSPIAVHNRTRISMHIFCRRSVDVNIGKKNGFVEIRSDAVSATKRPRRVACVCVVTSLANIVTIMTKILSFLSIVFQTPTTMSSGKRSGRLLRHRGVEKSGNPIQSNLS